MHPKNHRASLLYVTLCALPLVAGCSSDDDGDASGAGGTGNEMPPHDHMSMDAGDVDTFSAGMSKTGDAGLEVMLMSADPAPPAVGYNTWELMVHDDGGSMLMGATVTVEPWMPEHGHGSNVDPTVTEMEGMYTVSDLNFMMTGVWRTTITVEADGVTDEVAFRFAVE